MRRIITSIMAATLAFGALSSFPVAAQDAANLDQLLAQTRQARAKEAELNKQREAKFLAERNEQAAMLAKAEADLKALQGRSAALSEQFDANEAKLSEMATELDTKAANLGAEMFGVVRQVAGDFASVAHNSMISAQFPDREAFANQLAQSKALPSIDTLERFWFEMQREMTESGKATYFDGKVVAPDGTESQAKLLRIGPFTAIGPDGDFVRYMQEAQAFAVLGRQPASRFTGVASSSYGETGIVEAVVDPTQGSLLGLLTEAPSFMDQVNAGGPVGYFILTLAAIGILIALERVVSLSILGGKINAQRKNVTSPSTDNPLGRVLEVYYRDPKVDVETLELRLDEAIMKEVPRIEKRLSALKVLAAVGPLLGLFGTVIGMIQTFQAITLFGTGDPKLMAGGISQALVTTVQGLVMAIPLVLFHAFLSARAKSLVQVLEEESAGIIAEQAEKTHA